MLIQPARGYNIDPKATYHDPALVPPHSYFAVYAWLADEFRADAVIHLGKHGTLEWLPGKALALSAECFPEAVLAPLPHLYPFIVNDPGEGTQAKRRAQAVIIDHLTPPLTRAGSYGPMAELERLIDEYYEAALGDARRLAVLASAILEQARATGLERDCGITAGDETAAALRKLDGFLCELKELQIRDGLHVFGRSPQGERLHSLLVAFARPGRGTAPQEASLLRALAADLGLGEDPLGEDPVEPWTGARPSALAGPEPWRSCGDTVERLEALALRLVAGEAAPEPSWWHTTAVLDWIERQLGPAVSGSGAAEIAGLLAGLDGHFVEPGPSGAPSRGRPEVLPTGRNFYSIDTRAVPTHAAWQLGWKSAALLLERHAQEYGDYPARVALSAWGTANMRTGGDDIAQALALIGARPVWERSSGRVTGFEILPASVLDRPRVDVTLRVSGFFRDAFPGLIDLFDSAARAVAALDEPASVNPLAARVAEDRRTLEAHGVPPEEADRRAGYRVFGSKPGAYGAGLQTMIDERIWDGEADLAEAYLGWSGYAYGAGCEGRSEREMLEARLAETDAVLHNQDNREHDLLDSDDYYQFEGGLALVVRCLSGRAPAVWHNDHSRPETPRIRSLREELGRVVRGRAANPRWIAGVMRHGYKGAAEIAATVDYLFAFAATSRAVDDAHFDALYDAYLADDAVRDFMAEHNPAALAETSRRFIEAIDRGLWRPRRNSAREDLAKWSAGSPSPPLGAERSGGRTRADAPHPPSLPRRVPSLSPRKRAERRSVETEEEVNRRHNEKMARRKAARDRMLATKTEERGLLIVHTGKGKGKSTAAFGMVLRCLGHGMRVGIVQFVKGVWSTGERTALERFGDLVTCRAMGEGFTWDTQDRARDIAAARNAWETARAMLADPAYRLVLLDELNIVLRYDYLPLDEVVTVLKAKPRDLHVVVTGRNARPELIEAADLVTEMTLVKHPFRAGVKAQPGIEF